MLAGEYPFGPGKGAFALGEWAFVPGEGPDVALSVVGEMVAMVAVSWLHALLLLEWCLRLGCVWGDSCGEESLLVRLLIESIAGFGGFNEWPFMGFD